MTAWQNNLFDNLIVVGVLTTLALIVYAKVRNQSISDIIKDIRMALTEPLEEQYE